MESEPATLPEAPTPEARSRLSRFVAFMRERYCRMDPRTAGAFRIMVGLLCALDTIRRWSYARVFYSNEGVLTNHYHLYRPSGEYNFSVFSAFSSLGEVHVAFGLALLCHLLLMIGWHARVFAVLSFVLVTSLDNRLVLIENGGYVVVNLVTMYAMFLPIERRFSVDAWRRSMRERRERSIADLGERYRPARETEDHVSIAVLLVLVNLSLVYFLNVVNKSGSMWRKGETVHYVMHIDRMVTGLAVFMREHLPMPFVRVATWWTLCQEALMVPLLLWPSGRRVTRTLAILSIWALHTTFGAMMRLGPFSWFMIVWSFAAIGREQWDLLERWYRRRAQPRVVVVDGNSPLGLFVARVISRLDGLDLLRFEESDAGVGNPPLLATREEGSGHSTTGMAALGEIAQALPGGRYAFALLRVASLGLMGPIYAYLESNREGVARFFGLDRPREASPPPGEPSPIGAALRRGRVYAREGVLIYFALCSTLQTITENKNVPERVRQVIKLPKPVMATINYPRLYQGWSMFAPNPITDDGVVAVDGRTIDGRRIDPFTGKEPDLDLTDARGLGLGQVQQDYFNRIRLDRNTVYRHGLSEYLQQWHVRTGNKNDELVSFDVYWVRDQCPQPGSDKPTANEALALLTWRKPGYRPKRGEPPLPPQPKIESADTKQPEKTPRVIFGWKLPDFMQ